MLKIYTIFVNIVLFNILLKFYLKFDEKTLSKIYKKNNSNIYKNL